MQAVRQFWFFCLDKWVIECPSVELFEAMDCIFEVRYDLKFEYNKNFYEVTFGLFATSAWQSIMDELTWLLAAFPIIRFLVAKDTQALNWRHQQIRKLCKGRLTDFD